MAPVDLSFLTDFANAYTRARNGHNPQEAVALELLKSRLREANDQADSYRRIFEQGGGPALDVAKQTPQDYGGTALITRREQDATQRNAELAKIATEGGSDAATRFLMNLPTMFNDPSLGPRSPLPNETEIGAIGRRYGVPLEGQSASVPSWEGTLALKNKLALAHEAEKQQQEAAFIVEQAAKYPELNSVIAPMLKTTPEAIGTMRKIIPFKYLLETGRLAQGAERVDQGQQGLDLRKAIEAGDTARSAEELKRLKAVIDYLQERTTDVRDTRPGRIEGQGLTNEGKRLDNINKAAGKTKNPTELSTGIDVARSKLSALRLIPEVAGYGIGPLSFGGTPAQTPQEQYDRLLKRAQTAKERLSLEEAYRQLVQEGWDPETGQTPNDQTTSPSQTPAQQRSAAAPANLARPGEAVREDPRTGKRYVNRNGTVIEVH